MPMKAEVVKGVRGPQRSGSRWPASRAAVVSGAWNPAGCPARPERFQPLRPAGDHGPTSPAGPKYFGGAGSHVLFEAITQRGIPHRADDLVCAVAAIALVVMVQFLIPWLDQHPGGDAES